MSESIKQAFIEAGELYDLTEGIETANALKPYDEGLGDVVNAVKTGVKNFFGTKNAASQRNLDNAKVKQQTAANNAEVEQMQPPAEAAQQIINILNKALKTDQKLVDKNAKQQQKQQQKDAVAKEKANIENEQQKDKTPQPQQQQQQQDEQPAQEGAE